MSTPKNITSSLHRGCEVLHETARHKARRDVSGNKVILAVDMTVDPLILQFVVVEANATLLPVVASLVRLFL